jgi:hypothetical protein
LPALAEELLRLNIDVLVTHGAAGALAAKKRDVENPVPFLPAKNGNPSARRTRPPDPPGIRRGGAMKAGRFCVCESRLPPLNGFFFRPVASASIPCCASRWKSHCITLMSIMIALLTRPYEVHIC